MSQGPVLCAFDASEPSLLAAHAAAWLAAALPAPLELVYVVDHDDLPAFPRRDAAADPENRDALHEIQERVAAAEARAELQATLSSLAHTDVSGTVLTGWPAEVVRKRAADCGATLLVTGTAARRGLDHLLHGSVSGELAADAPCPVVSVAPDARLGEPGPVVVRGDDSGPGAHAVRHAEALAARLGRDLVRVQAADTDSVERLTAAGHEQQACLIVSSTRGRGVRLFGSASADLVRAAGRPVVLVSERAAVPAGHTRGR